MKTLPLLLLLILIGCAKDPFLTDDTGIFKDSRDQHEYKWVRIGEQIWMAENLAYLPSVSPSSDGSDTVPFYYVIEYIGSSIDAAKATTNYDTYGALYNWAAAKVSCPSGWHLPSDSEWKVLETYLGMSQSDADSVGWRESGSVGKALKFTSGWTENENADNTSGFRALPGGQGHPGNFGDRGYYAFFWTSTEYGSAAWTRSLNADEAGVNRENRFFSRFLSVRCIKDK